MKKKNAVQRVREAYLCYKNYKFGKPRFVTAPKAMCIETTSRCNLNCLMCNHELMTRKKGDMDLALFQKIVDESATFVEMMELQMWGEPLLNPKIFEMIAYAKERGVRHCRLSTNGVLLNAGNSERVIESKLDSFIISLDAATEGTYRKIRRGSNYELVMENVERYLRMRRQGKTRKGPYTIVQMIAMKDNLSEVNLFKEKWMGLADAVYIRPLTSLGNLKDAYHQQAIHHGTKVSHCFLPWQRAFIYWDGTVVFCGNDVNAETSIGSVAESSIQAIWLSRQMFELRDALRTGVDVAVCSTCAERNSNPFRLWEAVSKEVLPNRMTDRLRQIRLKVSKG